MANAPRVNFTTGMQNSQSVKPQVISNPPLPDSAKRQGPGSKYVFYCTHATMNVHPGNGKPGAFRNHVLRTDDDVLANYIRREFIEREHSAPFKIKRVTEQELIELLSVAEPSHPDEGKLEPLPNQGQDDINPDLLTGGDSVDNKPDNSSSSEEKTEQ